MKRRLLSTRKSKSNLFLYGVGGISINTPADLAAKFSDVSAGNITGFKIEGTKVSCYINKDVAMIVNAFQNDTDIKALIWNSDVFSFNMSDSTSFPAFANSSIEFVYISRSVFINRRLFLNTDSLKAVEINNVYRVGDGPVASDKFLFTNNSNQNLKYFSVFSELGNGLDYRNANCPRMYFNRGDFTLRDGKVGLMGNTLLGDFAAVGQLGFTNNFRYVDIPNFIAATSSANLFNMATNSILRVHDIEIINPAWDYRIFYLNKQSEIYLPNVTQIGSSPSSVMECFYNTGSTKIYVNPVLMTNNSGSMDADLVDAQTKGATIIPIVNNDHPNPATSVYTDNYNSGTGEVEIHFTTPSVNTNAITGYEVWATWDNEPIPVDFPEDWAGNTIYPDYWYYVGFITSSGTTVSGLTSDKDYRIKLRTKDELGHVSDFSNENPV